MWPKALAQLIELLPHAARLFPMADRFFQQRAGNDDATRQAMEDLRGAVGQSIASHEGLYRQMNELVERNDATLADVRSVRAAAMATEVRLSGMEKKLATQTTLLFASVALSTVLVALVVVLLLRH